TSDLDGLLDAAAREEPLRAVVDASDPAFLPPGDMPARIASVCRHTGQVPPRTPAEVTRCILDSLALAHRQAIRDAGELADRDVRIVHLVGGGARNALLCQLTADATGLPVMAGPVEAAPTGNLPLQPRHLAAAPADRPASADPRQPPTDPLRTRRRPAPLASRRPPRHPALTAPVTPFAPPRPRPRKPPRIPSPTLVPAARVHCHAPPVLPRRTRVRAP